MADSDTLIPPSTANGDTGKTADENDKINSDNGVDSSNINTNNDDTAGASATSTSNPSASGLVASLPSVVPPSSEEASSIATKQTGVGSLDTSSQANVNNNNNISIDDESTKKGSSKAGKGNGNEAPLRQGKWTREEEEYVHCLIDEFKTGMMPLAEGTSLRTFLSKMLNCHPMRISKKFVGSNYNGKQVYQRRTGADRLTNNEVRHRRDKLCDLERKFLTKISGAKKTAGNAAMPPVALALGAMEGIGNNGDGVLNLNDIAASGTTNNNSNRGSNHSNSVVNVAAAAARASSSGVDLRSLLNQAASNQSNQDTRSSYEIPLNDHSSNANTNNNNSNGLGGGSHSLQDLFQMMANSSSNNNLSNNNSSNASLNAFQLMLQQHSNNNLGNAAATVAANNGQNRTSSPVSSAFQNPKPNSRAAAAGRALLQSGGGLGLGGLLGGNNGKPSAGSGSGNDVAKPISQFTSAELAQELQKRSSLKDLLAGLVAAAAGHGNNSTSNVNTFGSNFSASSFSNLQDKLQQAAGASNSEAFSSLIRNGSLDMSNLIERQGSIDSLSNLAIRQSMQSLGSLMDPIVNGSGINLNNNNVNSNGSSGNANSSNGGRSSHNNSNWTPNADMNMSVSLDNMDLSQLLSGGNNNSNTSLSQLLTNNLSSGSLHDLQPGSNSSQSNHNRATASELMQSLGMNRNSLTDIANAAGNSSVTAAAHAISNSGLDLASLLNNPDAVRRLENSAPSSLNQNYPFSAANGGNNNSSHDSNRASSNNSNSADNNTAIAQFLLQKKLLEGNKSSSSSNNDQQQQLMMHVAAAAGINSGNNNAASNSNSTSNNNNSNGMNPFMSSLLNSLQGNASNSGNSASKPQNDAMESLKRKFFGDDGGLMAAAAAAQDEHRRSKPFR